MRDISFRAQTILNVDDYAPARYARTRILSAAGFSVTDAATGAEALQLALELRPQLVILDIHLPDISGLDVCRQLKQNPATSRIVVLHISATSLAPSDVIGGLEHGADSYLTEPVDAGVLVASVRALLRAREAEEALAIITAQENERRRIALELHDDFAQRLSLVAMQLDLFRRTPAGIQAVKEQFDTLIQQVETLSDDIRHVSHQLHPSIVEDLGLESALKQLVREFEGIHKTPIQLSMQPLAGAIPRGTATALDRIAQEALRNTAKHAPGAPVAVNLSRAGDELRLTVRDNGPGFDMTTVRRRGGLGLIGMRERARLAGGRLSVFTEPGEGTEVVVTLSLGSERDRTVAAGGEVNTGSKAG